MEKPPVPANWDGLTDYAKKGYSLNCREINEINRDTVSQAIVMTQDLKSAKDLLQFDEFYLPWNLDFRGRCYPIPHFNYHRDDHVKAMFELSNTKPMTEDGASWLAIHLANVGDFDRVSKKSFQDRERWTNDNSAWLCEIGRDFKKNCL